MGIKCTELAILRAPSSSMNWFREYSSGPSSVAARTSARRVRLRRVLPVSELFKSGEGRAVSPGYFRAPGAESVQLDQLVQSDGCLEVRHVVFEPRAGYFVVPGIPRAVSFPSIPIMPCKLQARACSTASGDPVNIPPSAVVKFFVA